MHETDRDIQNRAQAEQQLSSEGKKYFHFIEFDADEKLVTEIRKHPFGLFLIFLTGGFVTLAIIGLMVVIVGADLSGFVESDNSQSTIKGVISFLSLLLIIGSVIMTLIAAFLYKSNVIFVTSEKIAQVLYTSLFNRKISQLSIGDVQDVTVTQKGIFATIFKYGTLIIETAGEQQNYTFSYVPDPYQTSKVIVGSHERNLKEFGN
jgi:uncharacterized membrane protein YdbT with pleckstrin-like domain